MAELSCSVISYHTLSADETCQTYAVLVETEGKRGITETSRYHHHHHNRFTALFPGPPG